MTLAKALEKLLPRGEAFKLAVDKVLTRYVKGLAAGAPEDFRVFAYSIWLELLPSSTTLLDQWLAQFGIFRPLDDEAKREAIDAAWKATGGQGIDYFQAVIDAAGFDVTVHASLDPVTETYRRPLDFLPDQPDIGAVFCGGDNAYCGDPAAVCSGLQAGTQGHIVNQDLAGRVQPKISDDPDTYPFWIYVGGETFGTRALIPADREAEFQALILGIFPGHYWIGYLVDREFSGESVWDDDEYWNDAAVWNDEELWVS